MQGNNDITRVSNFNQSPRQKLFARGIQLHPNHHRPYTGAAAVVGFSGGNRFLHCSGDHKQSEEWCGVVLAVVIEFEWVSVSDMIIIIAPNDVAFSFVVAN